MEKLKINTERLFLRSPNINVCFRIKIDRSIDQTAFSAALDKLAKKHPLLRCAIEIDTDHNAWFVPGINPVKPEYYTPKEMPDWKNWYTKTDNIPFDFMRSPLLKLCVITGNNQTEIIILGHHIIGDGIGYLNLVKDLLLALDNRFEPAQEIPPVNNQFIKGKKLPLLSRIYAQKLNQSWRKNKTHFSEPAYIKFFENYRARFIPQIYTNTINEGGLKKIMAVCKSNNITVNELMTAAVAAAFATASAAAFPAAGDKPLRIGVAASTRGELTAKPYYCMGNYVTGISIKTNPGFDHDFLAAIKTITKMLRAELTDFQKRHAIVNFLGMFDPDLLDSVMFAAYGNQHLPLSKKIGAIIAEGPEGRGLGISNLGRHNLSHYDTFHISDLQFIGPAFPANILSASIITVNNRLNICLRYNEPELDENTVKKIYEGALTKIRTIIMDGIE